MPTSRIPRVVLPGLFAAVAVLTASGCASRNAAAQVPAGMKIGGPLTPAQVHAIELKRQGSGAPPP